MEHLAALATLCARYGTFHLCGDRVFALRIGEYVQVRDIQFVEELVGVEEVLARFAGETDDHVHANTAIRHQCLYPRYAVGVQLALVPAAHQAEYPVRPRLQGDVEVRYKSLGLSHEGDDLVGEQVGLDGGYPEPRYRFYLI